MSFDSTAPYVHLHSTGMAACTLSGTEYENALKRWLCSGCAAPKPGAAGVDVRIQEERPIEGPLTFVYGATLLIAHYDFLLTLGIERVRRDLVFGTVTNDDGRLLAEWVTVRGRHHVVVRGSENVSCRRCEICGRNVYFAMGKRYLYPSPDNTVCIYETDHGLVVAHDIASKIERERWPKLGFDGLEVLSKPRDAFGDLANAKV